MKKAILAILAVFVAAFITSCVNNNTTDGSDNADTNEINTNSSTEDSEKVNNIDDMEISDILKKVTDGITPDELMLDTVIADDESFASFFFIDAPSEQYEALVSMPMIGSIAHQIAVVRIKKDENISTLAEEIRENADPRKWICAEAEKTAVLTKGNVILVAMSTAEIVDAAVEKFNSL